MKTTNVELERWLLGKANASKNSYEARCWIMTAKSISDSYEVELTGYKLQCQFSSVAGATDAIQQMYIRFSNEPGFWAEIAKLVDAVRSDHNDDSSSFLRAVFQSLLPELQQTMLLALAEKQQDKVEQCRFLLLLLRLFPDSAATFGMQLMQLLSELEKTSDTDDLHKNPYSSLLVKEVTPILLKKHDLALQEAACINLLKKSIMFYVSSANDMKHPTLLKDDRCLYEQTGQSLLQTNEVPYRVNFWDGLLEIFAQVAIRCNWQAGQLLKSYRQEDITLLSKRLPELPAKSPERFYCSLVLFSYAVFNFSEGPSAYDDNQSVVVVVPPEAFFESFNTDTAKFPTDAELSSTFLHNECPKSSVTLYSITMMSSRFIVEETEKEELALFLHTDRYRWIRELLFNSLLLEGRFEDLLKIARDCIQSNETDAPLSSLNSSLHLISCYLALNNPHDAMAIVLSIINRLEHERCLKEVFHCPSWHYQQLLSSEVLSYLARVTTFCLWQKVIAVGLESAPDLLLGHVIVVLQNQWPVSKPLFDLILNQIRQNNSFSYEHFFDYVHHQEVLMNFAFVHAYSEAAIFKLVEETHCSQSTRQNVTDQRKDVRKRIEAQLANVKPSTEENLLKFLKEQSQSILDLIEIEQ